MNRVFEADVHNYLCELVIRRPKHMLGYPESSASLVEPASMLHRLSDWGLGKQRSYEAYLSMAQVTHLSLFLPICRCFNPFVAVFTLLSLFLPIFRCFYPFVGVIAQVDFASKKPPPANKWCTNGIWPKQAEAYRTHSTALT